MIETVIKNFLEDKQDVPVMLEMPSPAPESIVLIERTGGHGGKYVGTAMIVLQSYGATLLQAARLNDTVERVMLSLSELPQICRVEHNTSYNFTDPATKHYRYQAVYDITYYLEE